MVVSARLDIFKMGSAAAAAATNWVAEWAGSICSLAAADDDAQRYNGSGRNCVTATAAIAAIFLQNRVIDGIKQPNRCHN